MENLETPTARHAVSPKLFEKMQEFAAWYESSDQVEHDLWWLFLHATNKDKPEDRLNLENANEMAYTVLQVNSLLSGIIEEMKQ